MTAITPQHFGRKKTLIATGILAGVLFVVLLLMQTQGDFANGILFFISAILSIHVLVVLAMVFGLTYLFGGMAGKEVIIEKNNFAVTGIKYAVLIVVAVISYSAIVGISKESNLSLENLSQLVSSHFLNSGYKIGLWSLIPMLIIWLWATNQMRLLKPKEE